MKEFNKLSERQRNMLRYIEKYVADNGFPPTIRQIGEATGINSTSVVNYNLNKLVSAGYLTRSSHVSRGLRLTTEIPGDGKKAKAVQVPKNRSSVYKIGYIYSSQPMLFIHSPTRTGQSLTGSPFLRMPKPWPPLA